MKPKEGYTRDEWLAVLAAPYNVAMLIIVADMNFGFLKELNAMGQAVLESAAGTQNDFLKAVTAEFSSKETQKELESELEKMKAEKDPDLMQKQMLESVVSAANLVSAKSAEDGDAYRQWLMYLAQAAAEGSKEGGFLGIGAVRVSDKEKAAMTELAEALGVSSSD